MHAPAFRSAFTFIAGGCVLFALVLLDRLIYGVVLAAEGAESPTAVALTSFYWIGETAAVLLVSLGLLLPRLAGRLRQGIFGLRARLLLMKIDPVWNDVTNCQRELVLQDRRGALPVLFSRHAETQLHRRLVEIRDCEMASPQARERLNAHHLSVVERAELLLESRSAIHLPR